MGNRRFDYLFDFFRANPSIWLRCRARKHTGQVDVANPVARYTFNTPTRDLLRLFKCAECGARDFAWFARGGE